MSCDQHVVTDKDVVSSYTEVFRIQRSGLVVNKTSRRRSVLVGVNITDMNLFLHDFWKSIS